MKGNPSPKKNKSIRARLAKLGLHHPRRVLHNLSAPELYEEVSRLGEGLLAEEGALVVHTGIYTGRSSQDKFIVDEPSSRTRVDWGPVNRPFDEEKYQRLRHRLMAFLQDRDLFVQDCLVGADPVYQRRVRVISMLAWHSLFARNLFRQATPEEYQAARSGFTVIAAPAFKADPAIDGTRSEAFILLHLKRREILIGGTAYAGEIKKAIFTAMNYRLPLESALPMHCSANIGPEGDVAIFFGLSGTGKTTLSTDPSRRLIGDDEHGWSDRGIFNLEGGCYAKVIRLNPRAEPEIHACTRTFGTVLENVTIDPHSRRIDLNDDRATENTRAAYALSVLDNVHPGGMGGDPAHVILLTADAFGVLPPVARLTPRQAMFHFLSGYTAKLAGTERGSREPQAVFSACFGAPFMVHHPVVYAEMLGERLTRTGARCWLVNTGWSGGPHGVGERIPIEETRAILHRILDNSLNDAPVRRDPRFGLEVPLAVAGVNPARLDPRATWSDGTAYDAQADRLAQAFLENFYPLATRARALLGEGSPFA